MRKKERIARVSADGVVAMRARGDIQSDWAATRINAVLRAFVEARQRAETSGSKRK